MLEENRASILQEWHGLTVGLKWIVPTGDPYHRPVKDQRGHNLVSASHAVVWCDSREYAQRIELE